VAAGLMALTLAGCGEQAKQAEAEKRPDPKPIAWTEVARYDTRQTRSLPGVLQAAQRAPLSFEVSGRVEAVAVETGETFQRGQVLARLDARTYELTLEERRGQLAEAKAQLAEAREEYDRQDQLYAEGWASKAAYDRAKSALESARSRVETARARVEIAREDLADTKLEAPYAGTLAERLVEPSQRVDAGETVLRVQGGDRLEAVVSAPETVVNRLEEGTRHPIHLPARPEAELSGTIAEIATDASRRNAYDVTLRVDDPPKAARSGMTVEVDFALQALAADQVDGPLMAIPDTAFLAGQGQTKLAFVFDPEAKVLRQREIRVADITGDTALVSQGLEAGEIVATKGLSFLEDGQRAVRMGVGPDRFSQ
jgi:RND family efflux transporter MFP subunit